LMWTPFAAANTLLPNSSSFPYFWLLFFRAFPDVSLRCLSFNATDLRTDIRPGPSKCSSIATLTAPALLNAAKSYCLCNGQVNGSGGVGAVIGVKSRLHSEWFRNELLLRRVREAHPSPKRSRAYEGDQQEGNSFLSPVPERLERSSG